MANLTNKKSFVHRAFRRASEEPDVQIKREIKKVMAENIQNIPVRRRKDTN